MTFLELVQRLHLEAGLQETAPSTVVGQTKMNLRLVNWVNDAYRHIQGLHSSWMFRQGEFSFNTTATKQNYTPLEAGITDLSKWKEPIQIYSLVADETELIFLKWNQYRETYRFGSFRTQTERPTVCSVKPNESLELWAIPNAVFNVNGEYVKQVATMTADADVPVIPEQQLAIMWYGLKLYGAFEGAPEAYAHGEQEYGKLAATLHENQLPEMEWEGSLV